MLKYVTVLTKGHEFVRLRIPEKMQWHSDMVNKIELNLDHMAGNTWSGSFFCVLAYSFWKIGRVHMRMWLEKGQDPIERTSTFNGLPHPYSKIAHVDLSNEMRAAFNHVRTAHVHYFVTPCTLHHPSELQVFGVVMPLEVKKIAPK